MSYLRDTVVSEVVGVTDGRVCAVADCERQVYARELCARHYKQWQRHGKAEQDLAPAACSVQGCDRRAVTRGMCHGHYVRWYRTGDVRADVPLRRPLEDRCAVTGCERGRHSSTYCRAHYNRLRQHGDVQAGGAVREHAGQGSISHGYWMVVVTPERRHLVPPGRTREFEHRLVMAGMLGRPLTADETVHHRNGDRLDNRPDNLELWSTAQPKGQRVSDKLAWAYGFLHRYDPEASAALGLDREA